MFHFTFEARHEADGGGWHARCIAITLGGILTNTPDPKKLESMVEDAIKTALHSSGVSGPFSFHINYL